MAQFGGMIMYSIGYSVFMVEGRVYQVCLRQERGLLSEWGGHFRTASQNDPTTR